MNIFHFRRFIRKLYYLLSFFTIFLFAFTLNVKAEEYKTCFDKYKIGNVSFQAWNINGSRVFPTIPVEKNTKYYVRFFPSENLICSNGTCFLNNYFGYNSSGTRTGTYTFEVDKYYFDENNQIFEFTTGSNISDAVVSIAIVVRISNNYTVLENVPMIYSTNKEELLDCNEITPTPDDSIYGNFIDLYTEKMEYLAKGFTNNPYLLAMVGIIFAWVVLELFLKILHLRGGYRK